MRDDGGCCVRFVFSSNHDGARIQSLAGFFRLQDVSYHTTEHKAQKVRVTGYLLWDDEHNGCGDVGPTIQDIGSNGFHHPWRSTAWEIHPVMKVEVIERITRKSSPIT